jgi:putative ATP-binding cassette transporter
METRVMVDEKGIGANLKPPADVKGRPGVLSGLGVIIGILRSSRVGKSLAIFTLASVLAIIVGAYGLVRFVLWNKPFVNAYGRYDLRGYLYELGVFIVLAVFVTLMNTAQRWLGEILKVQIREILVRDLIHHWMRPGWASALLHSDPSGKTAALQVHEDVRRLSGISVDLALGLTQALAITVAFFELLWGLSRDFEIEILHRTIVIHGFLAWGIVGFSVSASFMGLWMRRAVNRRSAVLAARESDFTSLLEKISDHIDAISFAGGEEYETQRINRALESVLAGMRRSAASVRNFTVVTVGFGWIARVVPTLCAAPLYFRGLLSPGDFLIVSLASIQIQLSQDAFVSNFSAVAEWRAALDRVLGFRRVVDATAVVHSLGTRIHFVEGGPGTMLFANLSIAAPSGTMEMSERHIEIIRGDQVLVVDDSASGEVPALFRVLAGTWPWGGGTVARPVGESMMFVPRTPYLPSGTLRQVLTYPSVAESSQDEDLCARVLVSLGLERLVRDLDGTRDWDGLLGDDEKRCIAFGRVVLGRPQWLIVDQVFDLLDRRWLETVRAVLAAELPELTLIHFSRRVSALPIFNRVLHVQKTSVEGGRG